jgi:hypothetical protein
MRREWTAGRGPFQAAARGRQGSRWCANVQIGRRVRALAAIRADVKERAGAVTSGLSSSRLEWLPAQAVPFLEAEDSSASVPVCELRFGGPLLVDDVAAMRKAVTVNATEQCGNGFNLSCGPVVAISTHDDEVWTVRAGVHCWGLLEGSSAKHLRAARGTVAVARHPKGPERSGGAEA